MPLTQEASRQKQRMGLTHVGIICNIPEIQRLLPQVLIVPSGQLLVRDLPAVRAAMPPTIPVLRAKTKWISKAIMVYIVRLLAWTLRPWRQRYRVVLLMDVLGIHMDTVVTDAARDAHFDLLFIPAQLTWLLQPCDTHTFSLYKRHLRGLFLSCRANHGLGMPTILQWLCLIRDTIVLFMNERSWTRAFIEDGYSRGQVGVSDYILAHLPKAYALPAPNTEPTDDQLSIVFPKTRVHLDFAAFRPPPPKAPLPLPASSSGDIPLHPLAPPPMARSMPLGFETSNTAAMAKPAMPVMKSLAKGRPVSKAKSIVRVPRPKVLALASSSVSISVSKAPVLAPPSL